MTDQDGPATAHSPVDRHAYTHGYDPAVLGGHRRRTAANSADHLLPLLRPGQRLLDVGSGAGTITADLARAVAPGRVTAVEVAEESAALTRAELGRQGIAAAEVIVADAHRLPFADGSFDVVHAHQVLQHVADPVRMLAEMRRVTAPGGVIAVRDADYEAFRWFPDVPALDRWRSLYCEAARANRGAPDAGRRLLAWAHAAGLADDVLEAGAATWCYASPDDRAWWADSWAERTAGTALGAQLVREGRADQAELDAIAAAWRAWAQDPDGWFLVPHGTLLVRV
ncbi:methyltransferase domain-containing protein [Brachybacterium huguangmaarense]